MMFLEKQNQTERESGPVQDVKTKINETTAPGEITSRGKS